MLLLMVLLYYIQLVSYYVDMFYGVIGVVDDRMIGIECIKGNWIDLYEIDWILFKSYKIKIVRHFQ